MSEERFVYEKSELSDKNQWNMDRLKSKAAEWECGKGAETILSHRWHFINAIYNHKNNIKGKSKKKKKISLPTIQTKPLTTQASLSTNNSVVQVDKPEVAPGKPNLFSLNSEIGVDIVHDQNIEMLEENEFTGESIKNMIIRTNGNFMDAVKLAEYLHVKAGRIHRAFDNICSMSANNKNNKNNKNIMKRIIKVDEVKADDVEVTKDNNNKKDEYSIAKAEFLSAVDNKLLSGKFDVAEQGEEHEMKVKYAEIRCYIANNTQKFAKNKKHGTKYAELGVHESADKVLPRRVRKYNKFGLVRSEEIKQDDKPGGGRIPGGGKKPVKYIVRTCPSVAVTNLEKTQLDELNSIIKENNVDFGNICGKWSSSDDQTEEDKCKELGLLFIADLC
eukprot:454194_1